MRVRAAFTARALLLLALPGSIAMAAGDPAPRTRMPAPSRQPTGATQTDFGVIGNVVKSVMDLNGGVVQPGDILQYEISITNASGVNAVGLRLTDVIPTGATYLPNSIVITSGPNVGAKTDAPGDDQAELVTGPAQIVVRLGVGANATQKGLLPPGTTTSVRFRVQVSPAAVSGQVISNQGVLEFKDPTEADLYTEPSRPPNGSGPTKVTVAAPVGPGTSHDLTIDKSHTGSFTVGQNGQYNVLVSNIGPSSTTGTITVSDVLPTGLTFVSGGGTGWTCTATPSTGTCTHPGPLAGGASLPAITFTVSVGATAVPSVTNTASVSTPGEGNTGNNSDSDPTVVNPAAPDLAVTKSHTGNFTVGVNGQYTISVTNVGPVSTSGSITVTDTLPTGLGFVAVAAPGWTCTPAAGIGTCTHPGPVAPSASLPAITVTVSVSTAAQPSVTNRAWVSTTGDFNPANNVGADPTTVNPPPAPDLSIDKSHSGDFTVGTNGTYTLLVSNVGTAATTGTVTVTDVLPTGLGFVSGTGSGWSCGASGQTVTCTTAATVAAGGSLPAITLAVSVAAAAQPSVTNTASVANSGDNNASNNSDTDPTNVNPQPVPDLTIDKSHSGNFTVGTNGTYSLTVTNVGTTATTGATTITDVLPTGLGFVSASGLGWSCSATGQTVTCTNATSVGVGASLPTLSLTVSVAAAAQPSVTNTATVATSGDNNAANDSDSDVTLVNPPPAPDLTIAKSHTGNFLVGSNGSYSLTVRNVGNASTTGNITITDVLPAGLTYLTAVGTGWTCGAVAQTVTCTHPGPLAPTASLPSVVLTVSVGLAAAPSVTNTASVATAGDSNAGNNAANDLTQVGVTGLDLAISKSASPSSFVVGQPASYTLTVSNIGSASTTGLTVVTDTMPAGLTFVSANSSTFSCSASSGIVTCTRSATMAAGATATITLNVQVSGSAVPSATNRAHVSSAGDGSIVNNMASIATAVATPVDLSITKVGPSALVIGQTASFTVTVSNIGGSPTTGAITVTDVLPTGLSLSGFAGTGWTCATAGSTVTCTNPGPFASGGQSVLTLSMMVSPSAAPAVSNTATVATTGDVNPANNSASTPAIPVSGVAPDLAVTKQASAPLSVGSNAVFTMAVRNVGNGTTTGAITVTDVLQTGLTFVSATGSGWSCTFSAPTVTCTHPGPLAAGAASTITLTALVTASALPSVTNAATAATPGDVVSGNNTGSTGSLSVSGPLPPDLTLTKQAAGSFTVGQPGTYTITVTNAGTGATAGTVTVTDILPNGLTYVSGGGNGWNCSAAGQNVTCSFGGVLAPNQTSSLTLTVLPAAAAKPSVTNTATVSTAGDSNTTNNTGSVTTPVAGGVDLQLHKALNGTLVAGGTATYTLTITNIGQLATTAPVTVVDSLANGLAYVSAGGSGFSCVSSGQNVICTRSTPLFSAGESATISVTAMVASSGANVTNVACVLTTGDTNASNNCAIVTSPVAGVPDLALTKAQTGTITVGDNASYTLKVKNVGSASANAPITLVDTLPASLGFLSATGSGWSCTVNGGIVTCTRSTALAAGDSATVNLLVTAAPAAVPRVTNCAVTSASNETIAANNRSCVATNVVGDYRLQLEKRTPRGEVELGDQVEYSIIVRNVGQNVVADAIATDILPQGFLYVSGSARLNGRALADPAGAPGPNLTFAIGNIVLGGPVTLTYRTRVTADARPGVAVNTASVSGALSGVSSNTATASIIVRGGVFEDRGVIVGKVLAQCDCNRDARQNSSEVGIPGVRVYLEDGTSAITDVEGKYNFYDVSPRLHVVKVDRTTLPDGAVLVPVGTRSAGDGYSRFADLKAGEMFRADFREASGAQRVADEIMARRRVGEVNGPGLQPEAGRTLRIERPSTQASAGAPLASQVQMSPSLADGDSQQQQTARAPASQAVQLRTGGYVPLAAGARLTEANSNLPVTPLRAQALQRGVNPQTTWSVEIDIPRAGIAADGRSAVPVRVRLVDAAGNTAAARTRVTLEASLGRWLVADEDSVEEGVQTTIGGPVAFDLVAPYAAGQGEVRVTSDAATATTQVFFVPAPRALIANGLLNARVDLSSVLKGGSDAFGAGNGFEDAIREFTFDDDSGKVRGGVRGALLIKGKVGQQSLLTLAYDSDRDRGRTHFRDIRPEEFFPVYGDASLRDFDAQSRRRFFAQLDHGTSFTRFGDFTTTRADDRRVLSAYDRTLTGLVQHVEGARGELTLFASNERTRQTVDEFPARGISGPYPLSHAGLVNTERVEIITRDRNQPSVILSRRGLTRFADYTIEPVTGRLVLREPLQPVDANLNPLSIRVSYEVASGSSEALWTYGGDATLRLTNRLEVGASFASDETTEDRGNLFGLHATAKLGEGTWLVGEFARTSGTGAGIEGNAQRIELRHASRRLEARLFGARSDAEFFNRSSTFLGGRTELGGRFTATLNERTRLLGEALHTEDNLLDGRRQGLLLGVERRFSDRFRGEVGYRYGDETGRPATPATFDAMPNTSALRARLTADMPERKSSFFAEVEQDVADSDQRRAAVGGEYILFNRARLYGRHEWISSFAGPYALNSQQDQQITSFGIDADYLRNTQLFSEYRARDAFNGRDAEASIGVRGNWRLAKGVGVNAAFSRVAPLAGNGLASIPGLLGNATSIAGGLEVTRSPLWKWTTRLEYRDAETGDNLFGSFGVARKVTRDLTFLGRSVWDVFEAAQTETRGRTQLGLAWRQTDRNTWNALVRYENRYERVSLLDLTPGGPEPSRDVAHIVAGLVNWQPTPAFTLSGRYAAKRADEAHLGVKTRTASQLFMGRSLYDLTERFDAGVIGSALLSDGTEKRRYGLGAELGWVVMTNLRVAAGYNVFGFTDRDLDSFGTTRKGLYLELGFKFDESLFGPRAAAPACGTSCPREE